MHGFYRIVKFMDLCELVLIIDLRFSHVGLFLEEKKINNSLKVPYNFGFHHKYQSQALALL